MAEAGNIEGLTRGAPPDDNKREEKDKKPKDSRKVEMRNNRQKIKKNELLIKQDDSEHALQNTQLLNTAYSQIFGVLFGKWRYLWLSLRIICFLFTRFDFSMFDNSIPCLYRWQAVQQLVGDILNAFLWFIVLILAVFPSMRQLKSIVAAIASKILK